MHLAIASHDLISAGWEGVTSVASPAGRAGQTGSCDPPPELDMNFDRRARTRQFSGFGRGPGRNRELGEGESWARARFESVSAGCTPTPARRQGMMGLARCGLADWTIRPEGKVSASS